MTARTYLLGCMGAFEVVGDEIVAWRDYFDVP